MVYGLRYYYRLPGMNKNAIALPSLKGNTKLPVILNQQELKELFTAPSLLKQHKPTNKQLFSKDWVVYCKCPFLGPSQVVEYLGRYTHKVAISNHRIVNIENGSVTFTAKGYRHSGKTFPVTLTDREFIRRFAQYILPKEFTRIRHYGILSSAVKKIIIPLLQEMIDKIMWKEHPPLLHNICRVCGSGKLLTILTFGPRGPPIDWRTTCLLSVHYTIRTLSYNNPFFIF